MIYNIKHRDNLIEEFGAYVAEFAEFQQEMNEMLHMEYDQEKYMIVKEDHASLVDDVKRGRVNVDAVFKKMKTMVISMKKSLMNTYYGMSKDINDLFKQIKDIYEHNRIARFKHRNDLVKIEINNIITIDKRNNKNYYGFATDLIPLNPQYIPQQVDDIATAIARHDEEVEKVIYQDTIRTIESFLADYRFHEIYDIGIEIKKYNNVRYKEATKVMLEQTESFYKNIAGMNNLLDRQLQYIQTNESGYNVIKGRYQKDPKVMKYANEFFTMSLEFMNKALTYDNLILESLTKVYKNTANQLIAMKEILES